MARFLEKLADEVKKKQETWELEQPSKDPLPMKSAPKQPKLPGNVVREQKGLDDRFRQMMEKED